jgi:hypothetical protein
MSSEALRADLRACAAAFLISGHVKTNLGFKCAHSTLACPGIPLALDPGALIHKTILLRRWLSVKDAGNVGARAKGTSQRAS